MKPKLPDKGNGPLRVTEVTTPKGLRSLEPVWNEVFQRSETRSPFLAYEWILTWWEVFGEGQELWVLVLEDERGAAAIAPFARALRRLGPLTYRSVELLGTGRLRFLGMGLADRADFLLARRREECAAEVLRWLATQRSRWDVVDLRFVPDSSTTVRVLRAESAGVGLRISDQLCAESPYLTLSGTFDEYLGRRSNNFRKGLERKLRKLGEKGTVSFEIGPARKGDILDALADVVDVSRQSWKGKQGTALMSHSKVQQFFEKLLPRLVTRDMAYIATLRVGPKVVTYDLGFQWDGKLWSYDSAFATQFSVGSPGVVLTARILERAWTEGVREYDFLRGGEDYKRSWQTRMRRELQVVLEADSLRASVAGRLAFQGKWALKRQPWLADTQSRLAGRINRWIERGKRTRDRDLRR